MPHISMLDSPIIRFVVLMACASMFVICDTLAAHWGKNGSLVSLALAVILAPLSYILFGYLNQKYPLAVASAWITLILCLSTVLIGIFFFNDQPSTRQWIGLVLAIIAMSLLVT